MLISFNSALVTGGAGFIGSHLVEALLAGGCRVTVLDDLSSGNERNLPASCKELRFIRGDIRDRRAVADAAAGCEAVFHLAAVVSVPKTTQDPVGSADVNEAGSLNVLDAARRAGLEVGDHAQPQRLHLGNHTFREVGVGAVVLAHAFDPELGAQVLGGDRRGLDARR